MILQLPSTSLSETFGLVAQPLPCARNVYMRFAHASVLQLLGCMRQIETNLLSRRRQCIESLLYSIYNLLRTYPNL